jgi:hypothetical protein
MTMRINPLKSNQTVALFYCLASVLSSQYATAGPMGFKESYMLMGDFNNNWRESFINYAVTPRDAFGVSATYMRSDDKTKTRTLEEATYTRLLNRWNMPNSQANLWFMGGLGLIQGKTANHHADGEQTFNRVMFSPGVQLDYETTRIYVAANYRFYRAANINHDYSSVRAGFSFYETDYDKTQPWLIVEARNMNGLSDQVEITHMLRLINKSFFVEAGVNNAREPRFNFMYLF